MVVASSVKLKRCVARVAMVVAVLSSAVSPQAAIAEAQSIALPGCVRFRKASHQLFTERCSLGALVTEASSAQILEAVTLRCLYRPAHQKHGPS